MTTITEIEPLVRDFKANRGILRERVERCKDEQTATVRRLGPGIKSAAEKTRDAKAKLEAAIEAHPQLFKKPKTQTIEGIKIGFAKGKGKIVVTENAIELIKKNCPDMVDVLINTTEKVNKTAVGNLSTKLLKKIGCTVINSGDQVVVSVPKDDLDKIVETLLEDAAE